VGARPARALLGPLRSFVCSGVCEKIFALCG